MHAPNRKAVVMTSFSTQRFSNRLRSIAVMGLAISVLTTMVAAADAAEPKRGGSLVYAYLSGPGTLDPHVASSLVELEVIHHLFEPLVAIDGSYNARPVLASKIDTNADATVFTFTLRKGVKFHNGKEMNSADVLASFERYRKVSPNASVLADVEGFEAPDPYSFVIRLKKPNAVFVDVLKSPVYPFEILPAEQKDKAAREIDIVGTGPFLLGEWIKDSHLVIKRFDAYVPDDSAPGPDGLAGRRTAYLDQVRYNFVPEANARVAALQTGNADVIGDVPRDLAKRFEAQANIKTQQIFPY